MNKRTSLQDWQFYRVFNGLGCLMRAKGNINFLMRTLKRRKFCTQDELRHLGIILSHISMLLSDYKENTLKTKPKIKRKKND